MPQKYRADFGAMLRFAQWIGGPTLARIDNCRVVSLIGDMRRTVYATGEP